MKQEDFRQETIDSEPTRPVAISTADALPAKVPVPGTVTPTAPEADAVGTGNTISLPAAAPDAPRRRRLRPSLGVRPRLRPVRMHVRLHTLDAFRYRNYRLMWASTLLSSGALWIHQLVIGWLTFNLTRSPLLTSFALGASTLPYLVSPLVGVFIERWDRSKLLSAVSAYQAAVTAGFSVVVILGRIETWHIFAYVLAIGVSWAVYDPTKFAMIPSIVPKQGIVNALALNALAFNAMRLVLPAAAGVLVVVAGVGPTMLIGAVLYAGATVAMLVIDLPRADGTPKPRTRPLAQLVEGARYVRREPVLLALFTLGVLPFLLIIPFVHSLTPVYASEVLNFGPAGLGLMISAIGLGATAGTLVLASLGEIRRKGRVLLIGFGVVIAAMIVFSRSPSLAPPLPVLVLLGGGLTVYFALGGAMLQSIVPDELRGRVASLAVTTIGLVPVGALLSGGIAELLDAPSATLIAGVTVAALLAALSPMVRRVWRFTESPGPI